jgi:hypothetical protein
LFSAGLTLESARIIVGEGPAAGRPPVATYELGCMSRNIRAAVFSRERRV